MKSVTLKVPEELYDAYKEACYTTGTKLSHYIIVTMEDVVNGYTGMDRGRRKVSASKVYKRRSKS